MSSFVQNGNQNPLDPEKFDDFSQLLAKALGATVEQLNAGDLTVKDIFTQLHGKMREEYLSLRRGGASHEKAVRTTNQNAERPVRSIAYAGGW